MQCQTQYTKSSFLVLYTSSLNNIGTYIFFNNKAKQNKPPYGNGNNIFYYNASPQKYHKSKASRNIFKKCSNYVSRGICFFRP